MRHLKAKIFFTILILAFMLTSCEQVVDIDLNAADPQIVIEGKITDQPGPYAVTIAKTANYFEPVVEYPTVSNATVIISDNGSIIDTLKEMTSGTFYTSNLQGIVGRTYTITVTSEEKIYSGTSTIPRKVMIDSINVVSIQERDSERGYRVEITFTDPVETQNYYRLIPHVNSLPPDSIAGGNYFLYTDKLFNGNTITQNIRLGHSIKTGDTVSIDLLSIDKETYDYFNTLQDIVDSNRPNSTATPGNPNTNLTNNALGYFAAYAVDTRRIILR